MPQLGESVVEGTVDRWLKHEGELVRRDEPLVEVVTDKVNAEVPSPLGGRLVRIAVTEGSTVPIGTVLAEFEVEGEVEGEDDGRRPEAPHAGGPGGPAAPRDEAPLAAQPSQERLSPAVRRVAAEHGVDLALISGTGVGGRITRQDVLAFLARRPAEPAPAPLSAVSPGDRE